ncbi:histone-lysine N- H3 lysine-79 specific isoform X2 [Brachionus plicatilis]|uniref:Histone-lysine N-H3 lysine-79 specific isoform X2 n=1 Tax=Brachionus plicatilis TaxID=10195 RepID=A0A3M7QLF0_BRAPC|nr:histone-lysine N- H3 lysine-79 specific isoform X2 [Brachionus plicatilis]
MYTSNYSILKAELLNKKEELENQKKAMIKNNISLLKQRAAELGIKNLKSPGDLIKCAKDILSQHKILEQKINSILDTVSNKKYQNPLSTSDEKTILSQFLSNNESSIETNEKIVLKLEDDAKCAVPNPSDIKSVSSNSADETMTATERADDDEEVLSNGREKETHQKENDIQNGSSKLLPKPSRPHSNPSLSSKSIMDKMFHNDKTDSLKSFKIPKQARKEHFNTNPFEKINLPEQFSAASSSSTLTAGNIFSFQTTTQLSGGPSQSQNELNTQEHQTSTSFGFNSMK